MNFYKPFLFLLFFHYFSTIICQNNNVDLFFKAKKYHLVINELLNKQYKKPLTTSETILLSKAYSKTNQPQQSLTVLNKLLPNLNSNYQYIGIVYNLKSNNLIDLYKTKEALLFCNNALVDLEKNNAPFLQELCIKCGALYNKNKQYDKALTTYNKITENTLKATYNYSNNYGLILMNHKQYNLALKYQKKALNNSQVKNNTNTITIGLTNIAKNLIAQKKWDKAKKYLDSVELLLHTKTTAVNLKKEWLSTYYYYYKLQGNINKTEQILSKIDIYNKRIYDSEIQKKTNKLKTINQRKNILHKKVSFLDAAIKTVHKNKLIRYLILILILIIISSLILYYLIKNVNLKYQKTINEQALLTTQMTPHFIFNSLANLQGMILNQESKIASEYLLKFSNILQPIIKEQSLDFISINDEIKNIKDYIDLQNLSSLIKITYHINLPKNTQLLIPPMLIQPFIENAIIHGFKKEITNPTIEINFQITKTGIHCFILDNGVGYTTNAQKVTNEKSSLAIKIIQDRLDILSKRKGENYSVTIENLKAEQKQGTKVFLKFPYKQKHKNNSI